MNPFVISVICILILTAVAAVFYFVMKNSKSNAINDEKGQESIIATNSTEPADAGKAEMIIQFDNLPSLTEEEENRLIEINDNTRNINTLKANSSLCDSLYFSFEL